MNDSEGSSQERLEESSHPQLTQDGIPPQKKHVRPKIQKKSPKIKKGDGNNDNNKDSTIPKTAVEVEDVRKRMESWMGLGSSNNSSSNNSSPVSSIQISKAKPSSINQSTVDNKKKVANSNPKTILKKPKYSTAPTGPVVVSGDAPSSLVLSSPETKTNETNIISGRIKTKKQPVICNDIIIERDPTLAKRKPLRGGNNNQTKTRTNSSVSQHYAAIEGYTPINSGTKAAPAATIQQSSINNEEDEPLVIDSLEGLMRAAGEELPANPKVITPDTKMVEANISFSVVGTQDQYEDKLRTMKKEEEEERKQQLEVFMGQDSVLGDDNEKSRDGASNSNCDDSDDDDDDDAIMEALLGSDIDNVNEDDDSSAAPRQVEVRAFTLLWDALMGWMTPDTVEWVESLESMHRSKSSKSNDDKFVVNENETHSRNIDTEWSPMVDQSDIGASRCSGALAMIRLYLGQCMEELNHPIGSRRKAEKRLNDFMRTFDFSLENPKLTTGQWKAMTCILLDMVLIETRQADPRNNSKLPLSITMVGMKEEEFEYLSRRAVLTFKSGL